MKSVLISIQPKWVEKIANGEKTIEVRKSRPKLETPFKCYIYCTNGNGTLNDTLMSSDRRFVLNQKVIGEFVCDKIYKIDADSVDWIYIAENYCKYFYEAKDLNCCLSDGELYSYSKGLCLQGWHISNLKIYDKPRELSEFKHWVNDKDYDGWNEQRTKIVKGFVLRPLQSWCYVESLGE